MSLELSILLKLIGWIMTLAPIAAFLLFSIVMIREIANKDDENLKWVIKIGVFILIIGLVLLAVGYFGNGLSSTPF